MKIELPFEDQQYSIDDLIKFPPIELSAYSLTPMEKMYTGNLLMMVRPQVLVELGVLKARTSAFICRFMELNNIEGKLYGFDLPDQTEELRTENLVAQQLEASGQMALIPGFLPDSLTDWLATHDKLIDFALIDAVHKFPNVTRELEIIWQRLAPNGVIICHDYDQMDENEGVRYAVDQFTANTPDAQMLSLFMPPAPGLPDRPTDFKPETLDAYKSVCTLAVLRRRHYQPSEERLAHHLNADRAWKMARGEVAPAPPLSEQIKSALRKTPLYGLARSAKRVISR